MRVGVLTHTLNSVDGGFHYEVVLLNALSEIAPRLPRRARLSHLAAAQSRRAREHRRARLSRSADPDAAPGGAATAAARGLSQGEAAPQPKIDLNAFHADRKAAATFRSAGVDLLLMLGPYGPAFSWLTPFVMSVYDLNHRLQPEFPEVSAFGEFDRREYLYTNVCRYATLVIVNSGGRQGGPAALLRPPDRRGPRAHPPLLLARGACSRCPRRRSSRGSPRNIACRSATSFIRRSSGGTRTMR